MTNIKITPAKHPNSGKHRKYKKMQTYKKKT